MSRPITLFTGQWADLTLEDVAAKASAWGFDGLELACWGDHFEVDKALDSDAYLQSRWDILNKYNLKCCAISTHLVGQCTCDPIDVRHKGVLPGRLWGDGDPEGVRQRCAEEMKNTARAAKKLGVSVVNGFTGSSVWGKLYFFPPTSQADIDAGYTDFAARWTPILDVFQAEGVKFGLEVHPTEIAYDIYTTQRAIAAVKGHPAFGFNFDPSHFIHQFINPVFFIEEFADRIVHAHVKDSRVQLNGRNSILSSHLDFGDPRRGWDFVSPGRGDVKWDPIIRAFNRVGYQGPLSIEWEDSGMDREWGAPEALAMIRKQDFAASSVAFDAAFAAKE
jgi:sugar phosphate isomerase/epimerase